MNLSVSKTELSKALSTVLKAINNRSTLPVLSNVLLVAESNNLLISGTNLDISISKRIECETKEEGQCTVPAKTFTELISNLPTEELRLKFEESDFSLTVTSGKSKNKIKGIDANEFPPLYKISDRNKFVSLPKELLSYLINHSVICASDDNARPVLEGVQVVSDNGILSFNSTDGYRIAHLGVETYSIVNNGLGNINTLLGLIPATALDVLSKILSGYKEDFTDVYVGIDERRVFFENGNIEFSSSLIDGSFPNFRQVVPSTFITKLVLPLQPLLLACKQARILAKEGNNAVILNITQDKTIVSSVSEDVGNSESVVDCELEGNEIKIAFNIDYLMSILNVLSSEKAVIECGNDKSPAKFTEFESIKDAFYIIMPLHLG